MTFSLQKLSQFLSIHKVLTSRIGPRVGVQNRRGDEAELETDLLKKEREKEKASFKTKKKKMDRLTCPELLWP